MLGPHRAHLALRYFGARHRGTNTGLLIPVTSGHPMRKWPLKGSSSRWKWITKRRKLNKHFGTVTSLNIETLLSNGEAPLKLPWWRYLDSHRNYFYTGFGISRRRPIGILKAWMRSGDSVDRVQVSQLDGHICLRRAESTKLHWTRFFWQLFSPCITF